MKDQLKNGIIEKVQGQVTQQKLCIYQTKFSYAKTIILQNFM